MIMFGFHIFFAIQNMLTLSDAILLTNLLGVSLLSSLLSGSVITELVLVCVRLAADMLVFTGYVIQKKARTEVLSQPNYYPTYPPT